MKDNINKRKFKIIMWSILIVLIFSSIIGFTYAYFEFEVIGNEEASSARLITSNTKLTYSDLQILSGSDEFPGWTDTKTFTVTNNGTREETYVIKWKNIYNSIKNDELLISGTCSASSGSCPDIAQMPVIYTTAEKNDVYMFGPVTIGVGVTHTYTITLLFVDLSTSQSYNVGAGFHGTLNIGEGKTPSASCFTTSDIDASTTSITNYDTTCPKDIVIPETLGGKTVTTIADSAFNNKGIISVVIPNTVTTIGNSAFRSNKIKTVVIPNSVILVGSLAFYQNQMESLILGNSLQTIKNDAFRDSQITSVEIPDSVITIEGYAFKGNYNMSSLVIPDSVTTIGTQAFCFDLLTSLKIGSGVTSIGEKAFYNSYLTTVTIPSNVMTIGNQAFYGDSGVAYKRFKSVRIEGKSSSGDFTSYGTDIWGWASGFSDSNITWLGNS